MNVSRTYNYESDLTVYLANRVASMSVVLKILSKMVSLAIFTLYCGQLFVALLYGAARLGSPSESGSPLYISIHLYKVCTYN